MYRLCGRTLSERGGKECLQIVCNGNTKHRLNKPPAMVASLESTKTKLARPLAKNALLASIRITSQTNCNDCLAGKYQNQLAKTSGGLCSWVFNTAIAATSSDTCTLCSGGRYQTKPGKHHAVCVRRSLCTTQDNYNVRLVNGGGAHRGRVEVRASVGSPWGTVCDDYWDTNDAKVVCRSINANGGTAHQSAYFGQGSGSIFLDNVGCNGGEATFLSCSHNDGES